MLALVVAVAVAAAIVGLGSLLLNRPHQQDEVERFHRAAHLTSEWARAGVGRPQLADDALPEPVDEIDLRSSEEREPAEIR